MPALIATGVLIALGASEAGFHPTAWYAAGLFLLGLLVVSLFTLGAPRGLPRTVLAALVLFAAYTGWTYLSIIWAGRQGAAWEGANRTAVYLVVLALFALWPFDARGVRIVLGALGLGIAGLGLVELLRAGASAQPAGFFIDVRFSEPAGYMNANAALWTLGLLPCLYLAAAREVPAALRGAALGGAGLLASLALMAQSRGWVLALPIALIAWLVFSPRRVRLLAAIAAAAAGTLAVSGPVLAIHDDYSPERLGILLADATAAVLTMAGVLALLGTAAALVDRRVSIGAAAARRLGRAVGAVAAVALVGACVVFVAAQGSPATKAADSWKEFKHGGDGPQAGRSRFAAGGTNRYEFWTVAWAEFRARPVAGIGVENFQEAYLRRGRSGEQPRYAHSLELGVLSQVGLVGALLLAAAFASALAGAARARSLPPSGRAAAVACAAVFGYWLLHASIDWFWEFPALTGAAIAALGMAAALGPREATASPKALPRSLVGAAAVGAAALALSFAVPWLAELELDRAQDSWRSDPGAAFERLDRAAALNPLTIRPQLTAGTIALRLGQTAVAEREFRDALRREPDEAYALLELGLIAAERGDRNRALALLERATEQHPQDDMARRALAATRAGKPVSVERVNRAILDRALDRGSQQH